MTRDTTDETPVSPTKYVARCETCGMHVESDDQPSLDLATDRLNGTATRKSVCGHSFVTYEPRNVATDGGRDLEERRVDALEGIEAQLRYQNAALCELIATVEHVGLANIGVEEPRSGSRSYRALQTALDDHDFTRQEKADETGLGGFGRDFR
ncbi:hypothetical protein [Halomarina oriensis]|uniref:Uncharacterized protein n=1 Tax=Halomarina oriensis TaxID=671145 RepID=A0A6B0GDH0_9EURY|nr:hypothetical protein [Halomarina oriensis]MWG32956.1 hypothetical protein [Halomarina oriensis]